MIGAIDAFSEIFGSVPEGDISWNARIAKSAVRAGFGVVLINPNDKAPACTLKGKQAQAADVAAQDAAKEAGNPGWERVRHACGVAHVITEEKELNRVRVKELFAAGANIALAPGTGTNRLAVADLDTSKQVETFRALWSENGGEPGIGLTVASPGVFRDTWVHKDGGHIWFEVPEDVELPERKGKFAWCPCHEFKVNIQNPDDPGRLMTCPNSFAFYWGSGYVLVPPSVRPEGSYRVVGGAVALPDWLAGMARESAAGRVSEDGSGALGRFEEDPIDAWSQINSWADILTGQGFTPAGFDNCGCPTFTRPGDATHSKSVTAHEPGCSLPWPDVSTGHLPMMIWSDALGGGRAVSKLTWISETQYGGDTRAAMNALGLQRLRETPDISFEIDVIDVPKGSEPEITGGNSEASTGEPKSRIQEIAESYPDFPRMLSDEILRQYIRTRATEYIREQEVKASWTPPDDEDDFSIRLENPASEIRYAIEDVLPMNGNAMISAQFKSGKTTFLLEVIRALVDGEPFLGRFAVNTSGNVAYWNYELAADMMDRWLRDTQMNHPENLRLLNLRGRRIPLDTDYGQKWTVEYLKRREIRTWVVDPAVRAMIGFGDENDNGAVTRFTDLLDEIKERAGVSELIIAHHTGRAEMAAGEERARGATRWDDWPDSRWILTKLTGSDTRFIRMTGRGDRDVPESALAYEPERRRVSLVGGGDPLFGADRLTAEVQQQTRSIFEFVRENPGANQNRIMRGTGISSVRRVQEILSRLDSSAAIVLVPGPNRSRLAYLPEAAPNAVGELPPATESEDQ